MDLLNKYNRKVPETWDELIILQILYMKMKVHLIQNYINI